MPQVLSWNARVSKPFTDWFPQTRWPPCIFVITDGSLWRYSPHPVRVCPCPSFWHFHRVTEAVRGWCFNCETASKPWLSRSRQLQYFPCSGDKILAQKAKQHSKGRWSPIHRSVLICDRVPCWSQTRGDREPASGKAGLAAASWTITSLRSEWESGQGDTRREENRFRVPVFSQGIATMVLLTESHSLLLMPEIWHRYPKVEWTA